jgi:membrane dipeptidase
MPASATLPLRVFDLHCDTLDLLALRDREPYAGFGLALGDPGFTDLASNRCAVSLERTEDYAWCQCFAVWVPDGYGRRDAQALYAQARDYFYQQVSLHADRVTHVRDARDIDAVLASGKTAALLTVENAALLHRDVRAVHALAEDGVKMVALTWNGRNAIGSGNDTIEGLSTFGREAVRALEDERIVVDAAHLNLPGFADLVDVARRPFAVSHANSRSVCNVPRNLTDSQFCAVRDLGGIVGVSYCPRLVVERDPSSGPEPSFAELAAHVEHFLDLGGENTVALGSDWDGARTPSWLASCDAAGELHRRFAEHLGPRLAEKLFFTNARDFFVRNETA